MVGYRRGQGEKVILTWSAGVAGGKEPHLNIDRLRKRPNFFNFKEAVAESFLKTVLDVGCVGQGGRYDYGVEPELENFLALGCEEWRCRLTNNRQLLRHQTLPTPQPSCSL